MTHPGPPDDSEGIIADSTASGGAPQKVDMGLLHSHQDQEIVQGPHDYNRAHRFPLDNRPLFEYQRRNDNSPQTGGPSGACMTGSVFLPPADPLRHQKMKRNQ
jgi:hypothetical protein